jgi:uncharacterized protein YhaN
MPHPAQASAIRTRHESEDIAHDLEAAQNDITEQRNRIRELTTTAEARAEELLELSQQRAEAHSVEQKEWEENMDQIQEAAAVDERQGKIREGKLQAEVERLKFSGADGDSAVSALRQEVSKCKEGLQEVPRRFCSLCIHHKIAMTGCWP